MNGTFVMYTLEDPAVTTSQGWFARLLLPAGVHASALPLLIGRALRGFCDGFIAVLLPAYLLALSFGQLAVGFISSATLIGSALATILVGVLGNRFPQRRLLVLAAALMAATGIGFAGLSSLWPLLLVAFVGTLNPSSGDVSVFLALEQARLADSSTADARTALFARYSLTGAFSAAIGALAAALPEWLATQMGISFLSAMRAMFMLYALTGVALWFIYARLPELHAETASAKVPLGPSRRIVTRLALLFSVDAFAGGLVVNSLLALWLMQRFGLSPRGGRPVLFLGGAAHRRLPTRCRASGAQVRLAEHHGVHPYSVQPLPDRGRFLPIPGGDPGPLAGAQRTVSDGRTDPNRLCDGRSNAPGASGCRKPDRGTQEPGFRA